MSEVVLFRTAYFDIVGDIKAALVMSQIHYWYMPTDQGKSKLKVHKHGHWWIAKSHGEWWKDCRLTRREVDRALALLVEKGLIKVKIMRFNGLATRHIICDVLSEVHIAERPFLEIEKAFGCTVQCNGLHPPVHPLTETTTETTKEKIQDANVFQTLPSQELKMMKAFSGEEEKKDIEKEIEMKANDILKEIKNKQDIQSIGINGLILLWKKRLGAMTEEYIKPLTGQEVGQLKHVHKALGGAQAFAALDYALSNWDKFSNEASGAHGVLAPNMPTCGFFCKYHHVALQLIAKPKQSVVQPKQLVVVSVQPSADNEHEVTASDIQATLEALNNLSKGKGKSGL